VQTFETAQSDGLSKHRDTMLQLTKEQQQALDSSQEGCQAVDKELISYKRVTHVTFFQSCFFIYKVPYA
jgi:adenylate kinase